jgi:hypothetical protein
MRVHFRWALLGLLVLGAPSAFADPAEFALGAELVYSVGHSSTFGRNIPDAAKWGVGVIGEARVSQGVAQLAIWGEVQTDLDLPYYLPPLDLGGGSYQVASYLPIEIGLRPSIRLGLFEPHLGFIWTILTGPATIYGLGGNLGADVRLGPVLLGLDFRATGLIDSGQASSVFQGVVSARVVL